MTTCHPAEIGSASGDDRFGGADGVVDDDDAFTAVAWWRRRSPRLGGLLADGGLFVPWALYWGLLNG